MGPCAQQGGQRGGEGVAVAGSVVVGGVGRGRGVVGGHGGRARDVVGGASVQLVRGGGRLGQGGQGRRVHRGQGRPFVSVILQA